MEKKFYSVKDVEALTGFSKSKAYKIIKDLNIEIKEKEQNKEEKSLIFDGRINKEYFDKRMKVNI